MRPQVRPATLYIAATTAAAAALLLFWTQAWRGPAPTSGGVAIALVLAGAAAQHFYVPVAPRRKVDLSIAVYFAALLLLGAPTAMAAVGVAQLAGQSTLALRRSPRTGRRLRSPRSILFNTGQFMLATGLAAVVYFGALPHQAPAALDRGENLWALPAAALAMYLANSLVVAGIIGLQRGQGLVEAWTAGRRHTALHIAAVCAIATLVVRALPQDPWAALALIVPGAVVYVAIERSVRLAEQACLLRQSVERQRTLIEMAPDVIFSLSAADGTFTTLSPAVQRLTQCTASHWLGKPLTAMVHPADAPLVEEKLAQLRQAQTPLPFELRVQTGGSEGEYRVAELTIAPKIESGHVAEVIGIARDVTGQKTLALLQERERIAMDLHDGVVQSLFAVALSLAAEERALDGATGPAGHPGDAGNAEVTPRTRAALRRTRSQINCVIQDIRSYVYGLRLYDLGRNGLQTGLRTLAEELRLNTPIYPHLVIELDPQAERRLGAGAVEGLLHITREATSNVIRHAAATDVAIAVSQPDPCHLRLSVRDNGRGFVPMLDGRDPAGSLDGQGLHNMTARAQSLGGQLAVLSEPGAGTEVRVEVPLPEEGSAG